MKVFLALLTLCSAAAILGQKNGKRPVKFPGISSGSPQGVKKVTPDSVGKVKLKPGQFLKDVPVRKGPDGRPLLFAPDIEKCKKREFFYLFPKLFNFYSSAIFFT